MRKQTFRIFIGWPSLPHIHGRSTARRLPDPLTGRIQLIVRILQDTTPNGAAEHLLSLLLLLLLLTLMPLTDTQSEWSDTGFRSERGSERAREKGTNSGKT